MAPKAKQIMSMELKLDKNAEREKLKRRGARRKTSGPPSS